MPAAAGGPAGGFFPQCPARTPLSPTPRLGVALSGGGPRGRAHLGALQALHQLRIPVDVISGTSAGSLIGALYAQSLDLDRVLSELNQLDFTRLVSDEAIQRRRLSFRERERQINYLSGLQLSLGPGGLRAPQALSSGRRVRRALAPDPQVPRLRSLLLGPGAEGVSPKALGQREGEPVDFAALEGALEDLMGSGLYEDADFRLLPAGPGRSAAGAASTASAPNSPSPWSAPSSWLRRP